MFSSCGSVFSSLGNKEITINTKCDNCDSNNKFYRGYGKSEAESGPDAEMGTRDEAELIAYEQISQEIESHVMSVAARVFQKKTDEGEQTIKSSFVKATKTQTNSLIKNSNTTCREAKIIYKRKSKKDYIVSTVCIELSKKDLNDELYRKNKEMFSQAKIDYETFNIRLSAKIVDK